MNLFDCATEKEQEAEQRKALGAQYMMEMQRAFTKSILPGHRPYPGLPMNMGFQPHPFTSMFPGGVPPGAVAAAAAAANASIPGLNLSHASSNMNLGQHGPMSSPYNLPPHVTPTSLPSSSPASNSRSTGTWFLPIFKEISMHTSSKAAIPSAQCFYTILHSTSTVSNIHLDVSQKQRTTTLAPAHNASYIPETGRHYHMSQPASYSEPPDHR